MRVRTTVILLGLHNLVVGQIRCQYTRSNVLLWPDICRNEYCESGAGMTSLGGQQGPSQAASKAGFVTARLTCQDVHARDPQVNACLLLYTCLPAVLSCVLFAGR